MKTVMPMKKIKFVDKRKHSAIIQFIIDMHSGESMTSWMRWIGTIIVSNIMMMWTLACLFDGDWKINLTLEDMPLNLVGVLLAVIVGKVGQSVAEKIIPGAVK